MTASALYLGGNRQAGRFFPLPLCPFSRQHGCNYYQPIRVSAAAVEQNGGISQIHELLPHGIRRREDVVPLPYIFIRSCGDSRSEAIRLLLTGNELTDVGDKFAITPEAAAGSLFLHAAGRFSPREVCLAPDWHSLLNPAWRDGSYYPWLAAPATRELPCPNYFPWQTRDDNTLEFPGLPHKMIISNGKVRQKGEFHLGVSQGEARLDFTVKGNILYSFLVRPTGAGFAVERLTLPQNGIKLTAADDFNNFSLGELMMPPSVNDQAEYCCSRLAGKRGVSFVPAFREDRGRQSNRLLTLTIRSGKVNIFEENKLYYFRFLRQNGSLYVSCFGEKEMTTLLGWVQFYLDADGLPRGNELTINRPDTLPTCLKAAAGGKKNESYPGSFFQAM
jgi:hypothetical protein